MVGGLKVLDLQVNNFIPLLRLFQRFYSVLSTLMQLILEISCGLSLPYMVCLFLWFTEKRPIQNPLKDPRSFCVIKRLQETPSQMFKRILITPLLNIKLTVWQIFTILCNILDERNNLILQVECIFCHFSATKFSFEVLSVIGFLKPQS